MELIDILTDKSHPTADGWLTTTEIMIKKGLDPESAKLRKHMLKILRQAIRDGIIEQEMVLRPKTLGNTLSPAPGFRIKTHG